MNNPFFVLTSDENEIIGVIHNTINQLPKSERAKEAAHEKLQESIKEALTQHYDTDCDDVVIPADYPDYHKPIDFNVKIGSGDEQDTFTGKFTLTMAWDY